MATPAASSADALYRRARRYARQGTRSEVELRAYLQRVSDSEADRVDALRRLRHEGWLDDRAIARLLAEQWSRRGYARAAIAERLARKGIEPALAARTLGASNAAEERERARAAAEAYARRLTRGRVSGERAAARLARWLAGRGFDPSAIEATVRHVYGLTSD
jgi:SOS response regulatory protein OraA/RecX